ncbi:MAG: hypothetical protein R3F13_14740 [Prosthecobacter sp.]
MKIAATLLLGLLACVKAYAQDSVVVTSAPTLESGQTQITGKLTDLNATLTQLLDEASQQNTKLQTSLDRMGDPSAINLPAIQMIKDDILSSASALKTKQEKRDLNAALTGSEVFEDDANGLLTPIGSTYTKEDGTVVDRDPEKYKLEAAFMAEIKEYKEVREKAIEQQKLLSDELANVMQDLNDAQDFSSVQKYNSMISALNGQIEDWNQKVLMARADVDMAEKEYQNTARVVNKGKQEEAGSGSGLTPAEIQAKIQELSFGKSSTGRMPWGRKGSQSVGEEP